jgi:putative peptidoglycan lipid II flippase
VTATVRPTRQDGPPPQRSAAASDRAGRGVAAAVLVALGIFLTRVFGLVRSRAMAKYLGTTDAADVFTSALRIPNFLQNLFGEGVLSASFIPVYARLLAEGDEAEADRVAGAVFGILGATVAVLVALGVLVTPLFVGTIASGFSGAKRDLTVLLVRILFPGTGLLVLSAWCLGILNSHRRFLLSYTAPVVWNLAIIAGLVLGSREGLRDARLVERVAWWTVGGCFLQFAVQMPVVLRLLGRFRPSIDTACAHVREVVRNFIPVFIGRGAVQISAYVDLNFASRLGTGAQAALGYAQAIYLLPIGLFGMSISAAELPAMSGALGTAEQVHAALRSRLAAGLRRIAYFVVPSAVAFLALGDVVSAVIYQSGKFTHHTSLYVWGILAGSAVGLLASTLARLYSSTFYAMKDTRTPLRFALVRIVLTVALGWLFAFPLPRMLGLPKEWGVAGLTASAGMAGWVEFMLLRRRLNARIGDSGVPARFAGGLWLAALFGAACAWGIKLYLGLARPLVYGAAILAMYAVVYLLTTYVADVPEARDVLRMARRGRSTPAGRASPTPPA